MPVGSVRVAGTDQLLPAPSGQTVPSIANLIEPVTSSEVEPELESIIPAPAPVELTLGREPIQSDQGQTDPLVPATELDPRPGRCRHPPVRVPDRLGEETEHRHQLRSENGAPAAPVIEPDASSTLGKRLLVDEGVAPHRMGPKRTASDPEP